MQSYFQSYKSPIGVLLFIIIMGGVVAYSNIQTSLFPEVTFPKIKVIADAGLQPVNRMMVTVTKPLENAIKQVPDLKTIRSSTSRGSCEISAFMDWNSNIDLDKQRVESKIAEIRNVLPAGVNISVEKMNPSILPVMGYTIEGDDKSPIELRQIATYTVKPFLSQVDGVSEIRIIGGKLKEYWMSLNVSKMSALSVTPDMINTAIEQTDFIKSNGYLADYRYLYLTVTDATVHSIDDIKDIVISNDGKRIVRVGDIAVVEVKEAIEYVRINANGREGLLVAVLKQPNANLIEVSKQVEAKIGKLRALLPKGVRIQPYYIQADFVRDSVKSVTDSLWVGLALAILVALLFLRSFKAGTTILITIPVTLLLTLIVLHAIGFTFNIMTLGAIAASIGLIIDDAIVVVEQIHRTHEEYPDENASTLVQKAITYLFPAMLGSSISTIVIFIPFVYMGGVAGAYFKVLTNTMIITLTCSFFVTWLGLPVIYLLMARPNTRKKRLKGARVQKTKSQPWVSFFIRRPYISLAFIAALSLTAIYVLPRLQTGFLPEMDEGSIVLDYSSPPGTSLEETDRMLREAEKLIIKIPEVEAYSRRTGTQMGFFITEPNRGDYLIQLKKDRKRTTDEVINEIRQQIQTTQPALRIDFGQVIGDMLGDLMTSVQPIEVKVYGDNPDVLKELSKQISDVAATVKGTADVFNGIVIAGPTVSIEPNYQRLAQFNISPSNLQYQLQTAQDGNVVGNLLEREQLSSIRMVYPGNRTLGVNDIKHLPIFLPNGKLIPITQLATVTVKAGDAEIQRENLQTIGVVTARLENRDLGGAIKDIQQAIKQKVVLPRGYHIEYGGSFASQQQSFNELLMILIAGSLLVFGAILFLFKEFKVALAILLIAGLGISGSFFALFLTHTALNVGSYTGLIMIVGIIGENAIFTFLQFKESLKEKSVDESIVYSISTRLRPKLMTALGAIIALMPLALGIGTGAQLHQPLAIAVIGGFIVALPLLLIVLPSMLRIMYRNRNTEDAVSPEFAT